jgi:predicted Zn-dependent protease
VARPFPHLPLPFTPSPHLTPMALFNKQISSLLIFFLIVSLFPVPLGRGTAMAFSVGEEKELGEKLLSMVRKNFQVIDDPDVSQYVNALGQRILTVAGPQFFDYHFFVINDKEFNAFAAPSGLVFIHSGLIEAMDSEGELISVMAHECGHVTSRHISDQLSKSSKMSIGTAALLVAGIALGGGALGQALIGGGMAANASMSLKFSRQDEEEADRLSFKWMQAMNTDPAAMETMLQKMYRVSLYRTANIPPYLMSHPEPEQRMGYVEDLLLSSHPAKPYPPADDFAFLRMKQRVLSLTKDSTDLRAQLIQKASQGKDLRSIMAQYGLALLSLSGADYAKAEKLMRGVIKAYPDRPILQTDLATIMMQSGRQQEAMALLNGAHSADPNDAYTTYTLAMNYEQTGNHQKALQLFEELLPVIPDHAMLYHWIGNLEARQGRKGVGHYYLGHYFWMEGDSKNAKYHLDEAVKDKAMDQIMQTKAKALLAEIGRIEKKS